MAKDYNLHPRGDETPLLGWIGANLGLLVTIIGMLLAGVWAWFDVSTKANAAPAQIAAIERSLTEQRTQTASAIDTAAKARTDANQFLQKAIETEAKLTIALQEQVRLATRLQALEQKQDTDRAMLLNQIQAERQR
jgi:septal ring factor EnvC (AmiA/AmiB activator)